jgi:hypothetical protein
MPTFLHFKDASNNRETRIKPDAVQALQDASDQAGKKVRIIFATGQSMLVEGMLDDVAQRIDICG